MPHNIAVLGSTGSIGTQTLDIISQFPDRFRAVVLAAGRNVELLIEQAMRHRPALAVIADESKYSLLKEALEPLGIETAAGEMAMADAMERPDFDTVVTATVGYSGLLPTIRAIRAGKQIALANKETLVVAGELVTRQALKHPRWQMGAKITIDSATMLNKAFEIIEARWLFDVAPEKIEAVVHPQSIIHSMVEYVDGAVKAHPGLPDMHLPIRYALGDASRLPSGERPLSLSDYAQLTFETPDPVKFPCLTLAPRALTEGGNTACIINAANEVAVAAFLRDEISFHGIYDTITDALCDIPFIASPSLDDYVATHHATIDYARRKCHRHVKSLELKV